MHDIADNQSLHKDTRRQDAWVAIVQQKLWTEVQLSLAWNRPPQYLILAELVTYKSKEFAHRRKKCFPLK